MTPPLPLLAGPRGPVRPKWCAPRRQESGHRAFGSASASFGGEPALIKRGRFWPAGVFRVVGRQVMSSVFDREASWKAATLHRRSFCEQGLPWLIILSPLIHACDAVMLLQLIYEKR